MDLPTLGKTFLEKDEAREKFRQAEKFFRADWYADAFALLKDIETAFPNNENVLYAEARCLAEMGRYDEAVALCTDLIERLQYFRAAKLRRRILEKRPGN